MVSEVSATLVLTTTLRLARVARDGGVLVGGREFAVERHGEPPTQARVVADFAQGPVDLVRAGHEHERVAFRVRGGETGQFLGGEFPGGDAVERRGAGEVFDVHRVRAATGNERFARREVFAEDGCFQRGRHDDEPQVGPGGFLDLQGAGEGDVAVEMAFVELVEENRRDARQCGVGEHLAQEDAFGDVFDARAGAGNVVEADAVADLRAERAVAFARHAGGEHAGGQAAGLEDDDFPVAEQPGVEEHLRHLRRFARAGGCLEDEPGRAGTQEADEVGFQLVDGQAVGGRRHGGRRSIQ